MRSALALVAAVGALVLLLAGAGVAALTGFGPAAGLLGGPDPRPTGDAREDPDPAREGSPGGAEGGDAAGPEARLRRAVEDYYEAVDREDWAYTYENLDARTRVLFDEEEWYRKNRWFADNYPHELGSLDSGVVLEASDTFAEVVERTFEDGTSQVTDTYFIEEGGSWKHRFGPEEIGLFMPLASFEEFVGAQLRGTSDDAVPADEEGPSESGSSGSDYEIVGFREGTITDDTREYSVADACVVSDDPGVDDELAQEYSDEGYDVAVVSTRTGDRADLGTGFAFGSSETQGAYTDYLEESGPYDDIRPTCPASY